ncbi:MAG: DUF4364 family protein [Clostridia bacterium]|nr:DUF4364 family protein [Clostridia bacterium]
MIRDTFDAGVEPGGLHSHNEIKLLVCYMLAGVSEPMSRESIFNVLCGHGMANFFDISTVIADLLSLHNLQEDELGRLTVTDVGRDAALTLKDMLPYTLRERSVEAAKRLLIRLRNERENHVDIRKEERGYTITCTVGDTPAPLMSLSLLVGSEAQAEAIRERFLNDPLSLYRDVIESVSEN